MSDRTQPTVSRRTFTQTATAAAVGAGLALTQACATSSKCPSPSKYRGGITKSLKQGMIGEGKTIEEKFAVAKRAGFDSVEPGTIYGADKVAETLAASRKVGLPVDGIVCDKHWSCPLSHPDPAKVSTCVNSMRVSMENAKALGGDMVLLVPAVVNANIRYEVAYKQSQEIIINEIVPIAEELDIVVGLENVWNNFLLSPVEFRRYIEEIDSPYVGAWFDVGNILAYGWPQGWIRTLSDLIVRVDIKDFKGGPRTGTFVPLREGSVNWKEVMIAFREVGYDGVFAAEVGGGNLQHLTDVVSKPMDLIIAEA